MDKNIEKHLVSFANDRYARSQVILESSAYEHGKVDHVTSYTWDWLIKTDFYKKNRFVLNQFRGAGLWLWKPYIILDTFKKIKEGDIVMYCDSGMSIIENLEPLYDIAKEKGKMIFQCAGHHSNNKYIKKDCFILLGCDELKYRNGVQMNGAISLWVKNEENEKFLIQWMNYLRNIRISAGDDVAPNLGTFNHPTYVEHRHDQAVLSLLTIKNNFEIFRDPTQWGNEEIDKFSNSPYPQLFHHHRNFKH